MTPVDIYVKDTTPYTQPIGGVQVHVYNNTTKALVTTGLTSTLGLCSFVLPEIAYEVRFFKTRVAFTNPLVMEVIAPTVNIFDIPGELLPTQVASDSRACIVQGQVLSVTGAPARGVLVHFTLKNHPLLVDSAPVLQAPLIVRTDSDGFVAFSLLRGACYDAQVQGVLEQRYVKVPDLPSCSLGHLLFSVVARVAFEEADPYTVSVGSSLELTPIITTSSGVVLEGTAQGDVQWTSSDNNILSVSTTQTKVILKGLSPGTTSVVAGRLDKSIVLFHSPFDTTPIGASTVINVA